MPYFLFKAKILSTHFLAKPLGLLADDAGVVIYHHLRGRKSGTQRTKGQ